MKNNKDYINGILFGLMLLTLWYFSSLAIENAVIPKVWDYFLRFATNVVGVMLGALLAFKFNRRLDSEREKKNNETNLMLARFVLNRKLHRITEIYNGDLIEWKNNPHAWYKMMPLQHIEMIEGNVNYDSLSFLCRTNELDLFEAFKAEEQYAKSISVINERSRFHSDGYQNILTELGDYDTYEDFEKDMNTRFPKIIGDLKTSTIGTIKLSESAIAHLRSALDRLGKIQNS
uniref:Uncharacterized protein n=1 Tax=Aliivibrio wodanis TaxID=80852 RepID=A0A5Q4ZXR8_9GAMM|nr:hypothetical protein AW0309160_03565 [Aliivibrio wodanis]